MTHNASKNCIEMLKKCFEDNSEQNTPEILARFLKIKSYRKGKPLN